MSAATTDYLAAIEHMPSGAVLRVDDVPWEEYEQLLADLGEGRAVRIFYDRGRMEIMAPASVHERPKSVMHTLITALRDELDIDIESLGSTTLRAEMKAKGAEPDDCFYIQNAALVIGKTDLNLEHDPPPDLVIEIDRTSASLNKFPIYAGLGVTEIWRVAKGQIRMFLLTGESYEEHDTSGAFSFLSAQIVSEYLARGIAEGERKVAIAFRSWVREHKSGG
ncbi:MAG TPA: Uma2 family endonuclease [Blastocatellia bacterium]|jgi:Uma2 family endonuclease|nr:Uma2 family endonuclease [Blastocatellia bacterium]